MKKANIEVRRKIWEADLKHYQIAEKIGISHISIMNWLRVELTKERKDKILKAIEELKIK
jgi:predicted XRE-type DNA-binding protein